MRRTVLGVGFLGFLLLMGCVRDPSVLPPAEVLKRATRVSQDLPSVGYAVDAAFSTGKTSGTVHVVGRLQGGGEQMAFETGFQGEGNLPGNERYAVQGRVEAVVIEESEVYFRVLSLDVSPQGALLPPDFAQLLAGHWWVLPSQEQAGVKASVTPDPILLKAQAEVVRVVEEKPMDVIRDRRAYHYGVTIDRERLLGFLKTVAESGGKDADTSALGVLFDGFNLDGELWIDAETFVIHRLIWRMSQKDGGVFSTNVSMDFFDHGTALPVDPPSNAVPFVDEVLLHWLPSFQGFPSLPSPSVALPPDFTEDILNVVDGGEVPSSLLPDDSGS